MYKKAEAVYNRDDKYIGAVLKIRQFPLVAEKTEDCRIVDPNGKEYLDFTASWGVANTGYGHPAIRQAIKDQLDLNSFTTLTSILNEPSVALAEQLTQKVPGGKEKKVFFGLSGSDANDCAAKLAPLYTGRPRLISFFGAYHGQTMGSLAVSGHTAQAKFIGGGHVVKVPYPYCYRCPFDKDSDDCNCFCVDFIEKNVFSSISPPEDTAAIFAEAIQCDGGDIVPPPGYFQRLQNLCKKHNILLIMDEVKIGVGRTGKFFGFEHFDVEPDVVIFGKPIASGMPLSGVIADQDFLDCITAGHLFTTAGNPVSAAAGLATLQVIEDEKLIDKAADSGEYFLKRLKELQESYNLIGDVRGRGLVIGVELVRDRKTKEPADVEAAKICYSAFNKGLAVFYVGLYSNVLEIMPPLTITKADIDIGIDILEASMKDVLEGNVSDEEIARFAGW